MNRHHSCWLLGYLASVILRAAAAECDADLTRMLIDLFTLKYEMIQATARAAVFVRATSPV